MVQFAKPGDFCPNQECQDYQKLQRQQSQPNIIKAGKTRQGVQRFQTIFYRKRTAEDEILETLALLAEGNRISSLTRVKGHKEDTILSWLREAAQHAEELDEVLLKEYHVKRGQLDGLWAYVGNKGGKKTTRRQP